MQYTLAVLALAAAAFASPAPQGVTEDIPADGTAPANCKPDFDGEFEVTVVKPAEAMAKRGLEKRQSDTCGKEGILTVKLSGGVLTDSQDRTGYIADNFQFQFDAPPQTGATVTSGFSVCDNSTDLQVLALGDTTVFYQCLSGDFYNLYDTNWAPQCSPVGIQVLPCAGSGTADTTPTPGATITTGGGASGAPAATAAPDGQPQASSAAAAAPPMVSVIADGQPQAQSAIPLAQLSDGQPNMPTALVSQLGDGQIQATSAAAVPATPAPSATPLTQIGDGQVQAGNATAYASPTAQPTIYTGAAAMPTVLAELAAVAAGVAGLVML